LASATLKLDDNAGTAQHKPSVSLTLRELLANIIREEFETSLDWSRLYSLSWLYALSQNMGFLEKELYDSLKGIVLSLLGNERSYHIAIYEHESVVGLLFSLYHMAKKEENAVVTYSSKVLRDVEKLYWHEFDGEVMAFSRMLASAINVKDILIKLEKDIDNSLNTWLRNLDYESQKNMIYALFGFAYTSDKKLVEVIKSVKFYSPNSFLLQSIMDSDDIELIALTLYVLGKLAYDKKLSKMIGKNIVRNIRYKVIPMLGGVLERRISDAGLLSDVASVPRDLIAKIHLARIESGLDKPFMLSKYEWEVYQEVLKTFKRGYYRVHRQHLVVGLILNATLLFPLTIIILAPILPDLLGIASSILKYPYYEPIKWVSVIILNTLYGIDISLYRHGSIKGKYLLGVIEHIMDLRKLVKRG